jgi:hypothetical protein
MPPYLKTRRCASSRPFIRQRAGARTRNTDNHMSALPEIDPKAAAIDIGSEEMCVSIAGGSPKVFGSTTAQLHALRDYLVNAGVHSVAMEATGASSASP